MRAPSAAELLATWEAGRHQGPATRALLLLAAACPGATWDELASLPIGQRDARLLTVRELAFGTALTSVVRCPACAERVELRFATSDVRVPEPTDVDVPLRVRDGADEVVFRLPDSTDLLELDAVPDPRAHILSRCVRVVRRDGDALPLAQLGDRLRAAVVERMRQADPQANVSTTVECPDCGHTWRVLFDIVAFLWSELDAWAIRTLRDVHTLAGAYGWAEADILALSAWRRGQYLQLALA